MKKKKSNDVHMLARYCNKKIFFAFFKSQGVQLGADKSFIEILKFVYITGH